MSESERQPYSSWLLRIRQSTEAAQSAEHGQAEDDIGAPLGENVSSANALLPFIVALDNPHSVAAEQYRILAARLEGLWKQPDFQKVAITSTLPDEGKSLTTINVACVLAKDFGRRVLVMDGDFRKPSLWRFVGSAPSVGLSDVATSGQALDSVIKPLRYRHLGILGVGLTALNPTRLWRSQAIKQLFSYLGQQYDYVIVDTPPVLTVVDTPLIADHMDGVVVIVRSGRTPRVALQKALASLPRAKLVGTVLNGAKGLRSSRYYHVR